MCFRVFPWQKGFGLGRAALRAVPGCAGPVADTARYRKTQHDEVRTVLAELGLAK